MLLALTSPQVTELFKKSPNSWPKHEWMSEWIHPCSRSLLRNYCTSGTAVAVRKTIDKGKDLIVRVTEMAGSLLNKRDRKTDEWRGVLCIMRMTGMGTLGAQREGAWLSMEISEAPHRKWSMHCHLSSKEARKVCSKQKEQHEWTWEWWPR